MGTGLNQCRVAVCIPAYNEEATIGLVVDDFKKALPEAEIYVYSNNSTDMTEEIAKDSGAIVRKAYVQGKGYVVSRMFSDIEADIYILADGDATYPADAAPALATEIADGGADMVCGDRLSNGSYENENKRKFHGFGNALVKNAINFLFKSDLKDIMTGYRAFSRRFVKNFPVLSSGFEIETEMTLHALDNSFIIKEVEIEYKDRPAGSESKLNTFRDGFRVVRTILSVYKDYKPLTFFAALAFVGSMMGIMCGVPVVMDFVRYRYVYHMPLAVLAVAMEMLSINLLTCGLILNTMAKNHKRSYKLDLLRYEEER